MFGLAGPAPIVEPGRFAVTSVVLWGECSVMARGRGGFVRGRWASGLALALVFSAQAPPAQAAVASAVPSPMCQATGPITGDSHTDAVARRVQRILISPASN